MTDAPDFDAPDFEPVPRNPLLDIVRDIEIHASTEGWDSPPLMFALVDTEDFIAAEPALAGELGMVAGSPANDPLTAIPQEAIPTDRGLDEFLAHVEWPADVLGAALVLERLMLPPEAEAEIEEADNPVHAAMNHPARQEVRMVVAVLRPEADASEAPARMCAVRMREHDSAENVLFGEDLVPGLAEALLTTFES